MGLFNALFKTGLTAANNRCYKSAKRKAHNSAYKKVGKKIQHAKANNYRINGSAEYKKQKAANLSKAEERKSLCQKFIDTL